MSAGISGPLQNRAFDIVVAGGGNAALCAAISAAERGARVLVCEAAPKGFR
ncbi:MAG: FAD-dependent oxidoreductase, partial [Pseudomonadota bacterium]